MSRSVARVLALLFFVLAGEARAAPREAKPPDEMTADGDLDAEDLVGRATVGRGSLRTAPGGETWVSLSGFRRDTVLGEREIGGMVTLGLPLDRIARASTRSASPAPLANVGSTPNVVLATTTEEHSAAVTPRLARATVEASWKAAGLGSDD